MGSKTEGEECKGDVFQSNDTSREDTGQQRRFNFLCEKIKHDVMIHHLMSVLIIDLTTE